ncbi:MAG: response regulator [candidate division NC10 bacterium]|nr:response regulator [candidate division NC10 bacterium]
MTVVRILLVDDEEAIRRLLARRLTRRGYAVTTATDGSQALAMLEQGAFDLAILDYMMPGMNGLELAAQCRLRYPDLKVLILTGSPVIVEIEAHGYLCLRKPLQNLEELDQAIERSLATEVTEPLEGGGQ